MKTFDRIIKAMSPGVCGWIIGAGCGFLFIEPTWDNFYGCLLSLAVIVSIPIGVEICIIKQDKKRRE